jgi:hypothetical protein
MMKINNQKIVNRWNSVMGDIGCEHIEIGGRSSELEYEKAYYNVKDGISIAWMIDRAEYWLSCYSESGNVRCDDRFIDEYNYKIWLSESGKLKRLIARLRKIDLDFVVVEW